MNAYEQMKNRFFLELNHFLPETTSEQLQLIGKALDRAAFSYDVAVKETALVIADDPIPMLVKTYIVVKKTEGLSDATLANYYNTLKMFFLFIKKQPHEVTANDIRIFVYEYQQIKNVSDRTLDKYREYICWFFKWAHEEEYLPKDPGRAVKGIKHEIKERQALTEIELEHLRIACKTPRDKAMIEFLYSTGCRVSELTIVKKSDIDWQQGTVRLFGKGKKHRTSYINAKCEVILKEYLKTRTDTSDYLFVSARKPHAQIGKASVEKVVKMLGEQANLSRRITPHVLRHTTATRAVNRGMAIEDVSKLLGHASVATTMIYAKVAEENVHKQHRKCVI